MSSGITVRVISVHPWGCRVIEMFRGTTIEYTNGQLQDMQAEGRIRSTFMVKGKIITILPDPLTPESGRIPQLKAHLTTT